MTADTDLQSGEVESQALCQMLDDLTSDLEDLAYSACTAMEGLFQQLTLLDQVIDDSLDETETAEKQQSLQEVRERLEDAWQAIGDARDLCSHLETY